MASLVGYGDDWGYDEGEWGRRNWLPAVLFAAVAYVSAVGLIVSLPAGKPEPVQPQEKPQEVTFREMVVKPPEPPPVVQPVPPAPAPVVPKRLKVRQVEAPPPPKPLVAPREMPSAPPREADPSEDKGVAVAGDPALGGDPAGLEGGVAGVTGQNIQPIALPEDADPPRPLASNRAPTYPSEARAEGKTGTVVLKVVITAAGTVADVEVLRGEEPFVSAAVRAVREWKYQPATYRGKPIAVYRIIQIPFKLQA
jgi:protein TonB